MAEYKVVAKVVKAKGECHANHKVGDEFEFGVATPAGFCCHAFGAIWPTVNLLMNGGQYAWDSEPGVTYWGCPDTQNLVMFKLERVEVPAS
jgi:uncharacterized repeat protein (TIGR04076 family)